MGFLSTTSVTARIPSTRTFLQAVGRVMNGCGLSAPTTLTDASATVNIRMAKNAVNEALSRIWTAARWDWRARHIFLDMDDKVFLYDLPNDFVESGAGIMRPYDTSPMGFIDYSNLMIKYPELAMADETLMTEGGTTYSDLMDTMLADNTQLGSLPTHWTITGDRMGLFPVPWQANVDSDDWTNKSRLLVSYFGALKELSADADTLPVPFELYPAHHWLALSYFKQGLEYKDSQIDENRGERFLQIAVAKNKQKGGDQGFILTPEGF